MKPAEIGEMEKSRLMARTVTIKMGGHDNSPRFCAGRCCGEPEKTAFFRVDRGSLGVGSGGAGIGAPPPATPIRPWLFDPVIYAAVLVTAVPLVE